LTALNALGSSKNVMAKASQQRLSIVLLSILGLHLPKNVAPPT
jgi:hypothetical protein